MGDRSRPELNTCPRCRAATRPGDRYCANCGLRLHVTDGPRRGGRSSAEILLFLGPAFGGLLGFLIGETLVGQLSADAGVLLPIGAIVAIGAIAGGTGLAWLVDRLGLLR